MIKDKGRGSWLMGGIGHEQGTGVTGAIELFSKVRLEQVLSLRRCRVLLYEREHLTHSHQQITIADTGELNDGHGTWRHHLAVVRNRRRWWRVLCVV